jgi:hypothetical protein
MQRELRSFRRMPMEAEVSFQEISFGKDAQVTQAKYKDVSGGGLLVSSSQQYPLGALLKLEIRVPGLAEHHDQNFPSNQLEPRPFAAVGQVVRIEALDGGGYEIGVKFLNVYSDDLNALLSLINSSDQDATP